jgi:hypothetical protein
MMESHLAEPDQASVKEAVSGLMTLLTKHVPTQAAPGPCDTGGSAVSVPRYYNISDPLGFSSAQQVDQINSTRTSTSSQATKTTSSSDVPAHEYQVFSHAVQSALASYRSASLIHNNGQQQQQAALAQSAGPLHSMQWPTFQMGTQYQAPVPANAAVIAKEQVPSQAQFAPDAAVGTTIGNAQANPVSRARISVKSALEKAHAMIEASSCSDTDSIDASTCSEKSNHKEKKRHQIDMSPSETSTPRTGAEEILFKR